MYSVDFHIHTLMSGHHTNDRLIDVVKEAKTRGLSAIGVSEHAFGMMNGCTESGFRSLLLSPKYRLGMRVLIGAEANVLDDGGKIDLSQDLCNKLDYVILSLHDECIRPTDVEGNTRAMIRAMERTCGDILGHPADLTFPVNMEAVVRSAKETKVLIEINEASVRKDGYRGDNREETVKCLLYCKKYGVPVVLGSDSHGKEGVGNFDTCIKLLQATEFPEDLVKNHSAEEFLSALRRNR